MKGVHAAQIESAVREWGKALIYAFVLCGLMLLSRHVFASDGEFMADASNGVEKIIKGHGGKTIVLSGLIVASIWTGFKKDWGHFLSIMALAFGVGIAVGIINKVFTAVI